MAFQNQQPSPNVWSSESDVADEKTTHEHISPNREGVNNNEDDVDILNYPKPGK